MAYMQLYDHNTAAMCMCLYVPTPRRKDMSLFWWSVHAWFHLCFIYLFFIIFFHFRTIMNCNLKVIQARAFAQNQHLRYM